MIATSTEKSMTTPPKLGRGSTDRMGRNTGSVTRASMNLTSTESAWRIMDRKPTEDHHREEQDRCRGQSDRERTSCLVIRVIIRRAKSLFHLRSHVHALGTDQVHAANQHLDLRVHCVRRAGGEVDEPTREAESTSRVASTTARFARKRSVMRRESS